jgi:hypothetical protein
MMIRRPVYSVLPLLLFSGAIARAQSPAGPASPPDAGSVPIFTRQSPVAPLGSGRAEMDRMLSVAESGIDLSQYEVFDPAPPSSKRPLALGKAQANSGASDDPGPLDEESPAPPGGFSRSAVKIPSRFMKTQSVAAHASPDVSFDLDKATRLGLFGDINKTSRNDKEAALAKPEREKGAGLTLQYKFGSY